MNSRQRLNILVGALSLVMGCLPLPHYQHFYPKISGTVVRSEQPQNAVVMLVQHNDSGTNCAVPNQRVTTNASGHFAFDADDELSFFMIFGDRMDRWTVCAKEPSGLVHTWQSEGYWGGPKEQHLWCELGALKPPPAQGPQSMTCTVKPKGRSTALDPGR